VKVEPQPCAGALQIQNELASIPRQVSCPAHLRKKAHFLNTDIRVTGQKAPHFEGCNFHPYLDDTPDELRYSLSRVPDEIFMYQKILVPLDGSKQAESALLFASKLASISNAELHLLRVVEYPLEIYSSCEPATSVHPSLPNEKLLSEKEAVCREAENYLEQLASIVEMSVSSVSIEIQECPVVEAIINTVQKFGIDLIVMSTIGQDHNTWMMGAVTNRVLREAPVPVILLRKESWIAAPDPSRHPHATRQAEARIHPNTLSYREPG
jgi:nucleotide-binding universal stress UspA family protein